MPLLLMFAVFYFLLIRPQNKRQREHQEMLSRLKKGDRVVTNGGLIGTVVALTDAELTVELTDKVKVNVVRAQVNLYQPAVAGDAPAKKDGN
ncbi:MAG: preprotein translocase subunit YajC [Myxococcales bacterium]|nr:preprotein translocase subunit YajC [Myxococcales bacterium]